MKKIKFSFVVPVYNRELYLNDAVDSILNQNYGMEHTEVILVDDGSTDQSPQICDSYAAKFPGIVKVIHKENGGASSARNVGVRAATGDFINFLDSDDMLSENTLKEVARFIRKYGDQTDVIAVPIYFFDGRKGAHILNDKFAEGTRVIDLKAEWYWPQMSLSASFVRRTIATKYAFEQDVHIASGEDARELLRCLVEKQTLGVVSTAKYWYRKHQGYSLLGDSVDKKERYVNNLKLFHFSTIDWYRDKLGYVPKFIQYALLYDVQWRLKQVRLPEDTLDEDEIAEYKQLIGDFIVQADDDVILQQRKLYKEHISFVLYTKYKHFPKIQQGEDGSDYFYYSDDCNKGILVESLPIRLSFLKKENDKIILEGFVFHYLYLTEDIGNYAVQIGSKQYDFKLHKTTKTIRSMGNVLAEKYYFSCEFPLEQRNQKVSFVFCHAGKKYEQNNLIFEKHFPLDENSNKSYYFWDGVLLYREKNHFVFKKQNTFSLKRELQYDCSLLKKKGRGIKKSIVVRFVYFLLRILVRRPIWIVSDRFEKADDNGEIFFEYLMKRQDCKAKVFFAIRKDSPDYPRLKAIGPVVDPNSNRYRLLFLLSEYFISSQADDAVIYPFKGYRYAYKSLNRPKFIFLQHGIIMNDLSDWLTRFNKNIYGFITSVQKERDFIHELFDYAKENVWLTGMPRFDKLMNRTERLITIMPTWRKKLRPGKDMEKSKAEFLESEYYQFFDRLLHDKRLLEKAAQYQYTIQFKLHPSIAEYQEIYERDPAITMVGAETSYREIYAKSSLIVTDYSSAVFDFAYIKKPVIYAQFDEEAFFSGEHTLKRGYFDYREHGFGEVETSLDSVVDRIIEYMENDCSMKPMYLNRVEKFFAYHDNKNCERVYQKLLESGK